MGNEIGLNRSMPEEDNRGNNARCGDGACAPVDPRSKNDVPSREEENEMSEMKRTSYGSPDFTAAAKKQPQLSFRRIRHSERDREKSEETRRRALRLVEIMDEAEAKAFATPARIG